MLPKTTDKDLAMTYALLERCMAKYGQRQTDHFLRVIAEDSI